MIIISEATEKEALDDEWRCMDLSHYGKRVDWVEKHFRFKAEEDGRLVGTIDGKAEGGVVYIGALMVAESRRSKGIGTTLIAKAEEFGKKLGAHRTWLLTGKDWAENAFYQKLGFKLIGYFPDFFLHKDFVVYTRPIK